MGNEFLSVEHNTKIQERVKSMFTVDCHIDVPWLLSKLGNCNLAESQPDRMVDFPRMRKGELSAAFFALYLPDRWQDKLGNDKSDKAIDAQITHLEQQDGCVIVEHAEDARHASALPIFLGLEGGRLFHEDIRRLLYLKYKGVKYVTLTHNYNTSWADSATDVEMHGGLSDTGVGFVKQIEQMGIVVDVSHTSDKTTTAVLDICEQPVIASHSNCKALVDKERNLSDELIRGIVQSGGVVHITCIKRLVEPFTVADHIDHVLQLTGDCTGVGIGSDLDGAMLVSEMHDVADWYSVVVEPLLSRGVSEDHMRAIVGENTLRVFA
jgi:membrane dipeptidase